LLEGERHLSQHGVDTSGGRLIVTGGASQSRAFRQVLADLANRPVWATVSPDAASAGAAVQAMAALSGKNCDEIARQWQPEMSIVAEPDPSAAAMSDDIRKRYREQADRVAATSAD
jgi:xylulokinase